jgi:hypothetical protein
MKLVERLERCARNWRVHVDGGRLDEMLGFDV